MYAHVYKNNPTAGAADGSLVSEGDNSNPVMAGPLDASKNEESTVIKLAIRCEAGYNTSGNTVITPTGTSADKWALSLDGVTWGAYGAALTITTAITTVNTVFYAKAKAVSTENPVNDTAVKIQVSSTFVTV